MTGLDLLAKTNSRGLFIGGQWRESSTGSRFQVHDPADRKKLSYLATTRQGRRIYLNRSAVDADQLIVLSRDAVGRRARSQA